MTKPAPAAPTETFRLDSQEYPPGDAFAAWAQAMSMAFDVTATETAAFRGQIIAWFSGRSVLSATTCSRLQLDRTVRTIARSRIDHLGVTLITAGGLSGRAGQAAVRATAGDILCMDLLQTMSFAADGDANQEITLWIPRARLAAAMTEPDALHGLVLPDGSPAAGLIGSCLRALAAAADRASTQKLNAYAAGTIALIAAAVLPEMQPPAGGREGAPPVATLLNIRRFIDRNVASPALDVDMIAASFGLSRASLYRLFVPVGGVKAYIRKQRLHRAFHEITAPEFSNRKIAGVAHRWGFTNVSAFGRAFRIAFGTSPGEARQAALNGAFGPRPGPDEREAASLQGWMARMRA
jgi:AraC-like DNA-binding protein